MPGKKCWKYTVLRFSRTPRKNFWTLCAEFFAGLSFMHFTRPKGVFGRNFCLKYAPHIHRLEAIIEMCLLQKTFRQGCPICIQSVQIILLQKKTCWNIYQFLYFWTVSSNFSGFRKKIMTGLPKLPSTVSDIFRGEKFSHQKIFFPSFSNFELMIFGLLVKNFGGLTRTALFVSRGAFRRKKNSN